MEHTEHIRLSHGLAEYRISIITDCGCAEQEERRERMMSVAEELVEIIKNERRERGKSYQKIAEEIGVHRNTLMNVKRKHGW